MAKMGLWRCLVLMLLVVPPAACGTQDRGGESAHPSGFAEPAWMAQERARAEQEVAGMEACLRQSGWDVQVAPDGSFSSPNLPDEQRDLYSAAIDACGDQVMGEAPELTAGYWSEKYDRALETRDCLVARGWEVSAPPSREEWVESLMQSSGEVWAPFRDVVKTGPDMDEYYELFDACPQVGPVIVMG